MGSVRAAIEKRKMTAAQNISIGPLMPALKIGLNYGIGRGANFTSGSDSRNDIWSPPLVARNYTD